jgi:hypothetical protein
VITTILAVPNYRLQPTGHTVLQYWEVPAGQPRMLRAWFYPGDNFGQEFVYHKQTAAEIAAFAKAQVPAVAIDTKVEEDLKTAPLVVIDESGKTTEVAVAAPAPPVAAPVEPVQTVAAPAPTPVETAAVVPVQETLRPAADIFLSWGWC